MQPAICDFSSRTLEFWLGLLVVAGYIGLLAAPPLHAQDTFQWTEVSEPATPKLSFVLRAEDYYLKAYQPSLLSVRQTESTFDWQPPVASIRLSSVFKPLKPVVSTGLMQALESSGILRQGALALGGLQIGYGKVFQSSSVVELGRNGTAWEEPSCVQLKTCIQF